MKSQLVLIWTIADSKDINRMDLSPHYPCIKSLIARLFESPPPAEAHAELTFSYEGYRITVYEDGHTVFQPLD